MIPGLIRYRSLADQFELLCYGCHGFYNLFVWNMIISVVVIVRCRTVCMRILLLHDNLITIEDSLGTKLWAFWIANAVSVQPWVHCCWDLSKMKLFDRIWGWERIEIIWQWSAWGCSESDQEYNDSKASRRSEGLSSGFPCRFDTSGISFCR